jgi:23S rRNA (guanosine2251-2'-O)-methyltransferase
MKKLSMDDLQRKDINSFKNADKTPLIIILDDIRSLHNIGSVFRTSDAFLIEKIYLCGFTATPPNKEIHKTALGATETVTWEYCKDILELITKLQENNIKILAIEQTENSVFLNDFQPIANQKYALILGNEVYGVNQDAIYQCENVIEIPQWGSKHSLNVSVACGIVVWDLVNKMKN